jgi:hypothetical protein
MGMQADGTRTVEATLLRDVGSGFAFWYLLSAIKEQRTKGLRMKFKYLWLATILWSGVLTAAAQSGSIVGTWTLIAADKLLPDGARTSDFGDNPHGLVIFTADGHYSVEIYRANRAKFSSDDRAEVSAEEYKKAASSMSVHFGRYTVDPAKHTISFQIDRASWSNWDDTVQVRTYELKDDELSWKVAPRPDGSIPVTVLRRVSVRNQPDLTCSTPDEEHNKEGKTRDPDY